MRGSSQAVLVPGLSVLGGAAAGFSYEGALRDALARRDGQRGPQAGQRQSVRSRPSQAPRADAPTVEAALERQS